MAQTLSRSADGRWWLPVLRNRIDWLLLIVDAVVLIGVETFVSTYRHGRPIWLGALMALLILLVLEVAGVYQTRFAVSSLDELPRLAGWSLIASLVLVFLLEPSVEAADIVVMAALTFGALFTVRVVYFGLVRGVRRRRPERRLRTAVLGGGMVAQEIVLSTRERPELGVNVVVAISPDPMLQFLDTGVPTLPDLRRLRAIVEDWDIDAVIVAFGSNPDVDLVDPLRECDSLDCEIYIVPRLFEFTSVTHDMDRLHTIPLIRVRRDALRTWYWKLKRVFDVVVAAVALVLASPVLAVAAMAVYVSEPSAPILFRQKRIGKDGTVFNLLKFRSMRPVPTTTSDADWHPCDEERIGRVGHFIRKTSLDELPQLWNVLRGDMSMVGPRPERPHFVREFTDSVPGYEYRHRVDVGLTGWAAIHGLRGDTSITDRAIFDNYYIENWSVWLDIKIIILTVSAVLRGTGS
ncbi:sugar transferase [Gordonia rhizosphera]|uniref:Putative glycosyltransferase n=1 Tax=Gordonia rhizosphera NBRC 16068 TaxID=1108045 RepID=K6WI50_9ACTN|nr:sugar transferase [Gordonia rhizosphera]GAB91802.1 putative glycosyltransferase [Gordonia rhizosphera NBRC 16068]